jgi:hypothetical protein
MPDKMKKINRFKLKELKLWNDELIKNLNKNIYSPKL